MKSIRKSKEPVTEPLSVYDALERAYQVKLLPLEESCHFHFLAQSPIEKGYFSAKAMVLVIGQYSVGKSTFINHLIGEKYPGVLEGPEPTTDSFNVICHGESNCITTGHSVVADATRPFGSLRNFGNNFLQKLRLCTVQNELLRHVTFVDTPGILSGKEKHLSRGYDFNEVIIWFAERCDRIIIMSDAHKLDISDEFRDVINLLRRFDSKVRILLNKSDNCSGQQLLRVYGALMWNFGRIMNTPEVAKVYVGSFWQKPLNHTQFKSMMEAEYRDLLSDLSILPYQTTKRKIDDLLQRASQVKIVAFLAEYLYGKMSILWADAKKKQLISNLDTIYQELANTHDLPLSDFPPADKMKQSLESFDFKKFTKTSKNKLKNVEDMIKDDLPAVLRRVDGDLQMTRDDSNLTAGAFQCLKLNETSDGPFSQRVTRNIESADSLENWIGEETLALYVQEFQSLSGDQSTVKATVVASELRKSNLQDTMLSRIYSLADPAGTSVSQSEYCIMRYLTDMMSKGEELPDKIPSHLKD